jgi:hypothetical protein
MTMCKSRYKALPIDGIRHCERSEAIQNFMRRDWIASSLTLLAMTLEEWPGEKTG